VFTNKRELGSKPLSSDDVEDNADIKPIPVVESNVKSEIVDAEPSEFVSQHCFKADVKVEDKQTLKDGCGNYAMTSVDATDKNMGNEPEPASVDDADCQGNKPEKIEDDSNLKITGMAR
jgi:hypothetical protein